MQFPSLPFLSLFPPPQQFNFTSPPKKRRRRSNSKTLFSYINSRNQMIQSITRNTHTQSEKAKILLPCFDRDDNSNKNKNSRKQKMSLCRGFQSCLLEPRVIIAPSKAGLSLPWPHKQSHATMLESSSNHAYVHPLSTSFLSAKSLEMCTESIGSETGSGIDHFSSCHVTKEERERERERERESQSCVQPRGSIKKVSKHGGGFPPPLTSISGSEGVVRVRTHREGGRLVIEAFTLSSSRCSFVAERGDGRLRLSLQKDGGGGEKEHLYVKDGCVYGGIRCNGGERKRLQSLPFCVAGIS